MNASSDGCSFAFTGTATNPPLKSPNMTVRYSGRLGMKMTTRSPAAYPLRTRPPAKAAARASSSA